MDPPPAKRPRLSMACNECRRRKVKCDDIYPKCKNCRDRNSDCFTSDPKQPDIPVQREWTKPAEKPAQHPHSMYSTAPVQNDSTTQLTPTHRTVLSQKPEDRVQPSFRASISHSPSVTNDAGTGIPTATTDVSSIHQPFDMSFNVDLVNNRYKMVGGSSSQCLSKSLDVYLRTYGVEPVAALFRHGMKHSEEFDLQLVMQTIPFPGFAARQEYLDAYFSRLHVFYPIFDIDKTKAIVQQIASLPNPANVPYSSVPLVATAYLLMSLGADEKNGSPSDVGADYLRAGAALVGHLINFPYLATVQALLLLALCYRARNKDGLAWHTVGMAVRTAQSLGLHRHSAISPSAQHGIQQKDLQLFHARIWAICCCLEKIGQLESGRPSAINSVDTDQMMGRDQRPPGHDFLQWNMALAGVQHDISTHLYGHRPGERTSKQILLDSAKLDKQLLAWPTLIPAEFRPGNDILCADDQFHLAAFLSFQYHQSVIAVHRAALIQPRAALQQEINNLLPDNDARFRLQGGETICVGSARAIAKITIELLDRKLSSQLLSAGPGLLACIVLAVFIVKNPDGRMQASDLELLRSVAEWTTSQYRISGMDERFCQGVTNIHERVVESLSQRRLAQSSRNGHVPSSSSRQNHNNNSGSGRETLSDTANDDRTLHTNNADTFAYQEHYGEVPNTSATSMLANGAGGLSQPSHESSTMHISHVLLNPTDPDAHSDNIEQSFNFDCTPPFEGYNLEDLWNWMLLTDPGANLGGTDLDGWMGTDFDNDH